MLKFGSTDHLPESHRSLFESRSSWMAAGAVCAKKLQKVWEGPCWEGMWPSLNIAKKYGPYGQLFFFLVKKEPVVVREAVDFGPCVPAEALKACALIGLHVVADEVTSLSLNGLSPELGDEWEVWHSKDFVERRRWRLDTHLPVRCVTPTLKVSLFKSLGRTGQAKWCLSFLRIGSFCG